ncbi:Protein SEH1 [Camellia lanceoleosa]|uniref:Protein SEH1 n=1 Tax=Camellia lanceoleosa TaxID=1840588 RepID=A0ACC0HUK2_9ERIC|nr:Protein SEH1 [Camellia lanceoleosa]
MNSVVTFDKGTTCSSWNYCGERLATGSINGALAIFDSVDPASSSFTCTSTSRVHEVSIVKVFCVPPEYGGGVACICADGTLLLWEEVAAYSNDHVKVYELLDPLELKNWQLQAEFQNVIDSVSKFGKAACLSASISWTPQRGESQQLSFVLGFNLNVMQLNSAKGLWNGNCSSKVDKVNLDRQKKVVVQRQPRESLRAKKSGVENVNQKETGSESKIGNKKKSRNRSVEIVLLRLTMLIWIVRIRVCGNCFSKVDNVNLDRKNKVVVVQRQPRESLGAKKSGVKNVNKKETKSKSKIGNKKKS